MGADRQRDQFNSPSAISVGLCCSWREKKDTESTENKKDQTEKKNIDGGAKGKEGRTLKNRERRALQNSTAKTEVNCDENGRSHDHNSG